MSEIGTRGTVITTNRTVLSYGKCCCQLELDLLAIQMLHNHITTGYVRTKPINLSLPLPTVCGLGFGLMSGAFSLFNVLADSIGPGTVGIFGDSNYFFLASSFLTLGFILLHISWGVIFFKACDSRSKTLVAYVIASHLVASKISLLNQHYTYLLSIFLTYLLAAITGLIALSVSGCSLSTVKSAFGRN